MNLVKDVRQTFEGYEFYVVEGAFRDSVVLLIEYGGGQISGTPSKTTINIARQLVDVPRDMKFHVLGIDFITSCLHKGFLERAREYILRDDYVYPPTFTSDFRKFHAKASQTVFKCDKSFCDDSDVEILEESTNGMTRGDFAEDVRTSKQLPSKCLVEWVHRVYEETRNVTADDTIIILSSDEEVVMTKQQDCRPNRMVEKRHKYYGNTIRDAKRCSRARSTHSDEEADRPSSKQHRQRKDIDEESCTYKKRIRKLKKHNSARTPDSNSDSDEKVNTSKQHRRGGGNKDKSPISKNVSERQHRRAEANRDGSRVNTTRNVKKGNRVRTPDSDEEVNVSDGQHRQAEANRDKSSRVNTTGNVKKGNRVRTPDSDEEVNVSDGQHRQAEANRDKSSRVNTTGNVKKGNRVRTPDSDEEVNLSEGQHIQAEANRDESSRVNTTRNVKKGNRARTPDSDEEVDVSEGQHRQAEANRDKSSRVNTTGNLKKGNMVRTPDSDEEVNLSEGQHRQAEANKDESSRVNTTGNLKKGNRVRTPDSDEEVNVSERQHRQAEANRDESSRVKTTGNLKKGNRVRTPDSDEEVNVSEGQHRQAEANRDGSSRVNTTGNVKKGNSVRTPDSDEEVNVSERQHRKAEANRDESRLFRNTRKLKKGKGIIYCDEEVNASRQGEDVDERAQVSVDARHVGIYDQSNEVRNDEPTLGGSVHSESSAGSSRSRQEPKTLRGNVESNDSETVSLPVATPTFDLFQSVQDRRQKLERFRKTSQQVQRSESDEEFLQESKDLTKAVAPLTLPFRQPFSMQEKKTIVTHIRDNELHNQVKGNTMWRRMAKENIVKGRSWQSLQEHFKKQILPKIETYENIVLSAEDVELFKNINRPQSSVPITRSQISKRLESIRLRRALQEEAPGPTPSTSKEAHGTDVFQARAGLSPSPGDDGGQPRGVFNFAFGLSDGAEAGIDIDVVKLGDMTLTLISLKEPEFLPALASDKDLVCALCPSCKNHTVYSQLNLEHVGSDTPGHCPRCAQKGIEIEMRFSFRLVLEVGSDSRYQELNVVGLDARRLLGCTEAEFLEDEALRQRVLDTLADAVVTQAALRGTVVCTSHHDFMGVFLTCPTPLALD